MRTCRNNITTVSCQRSAAVDMQVVIFSKSYCPFCAKAKRALGSVIDMSKVTVLEVRPSCCACKSVREEVLRLLHTAPRCRAQLERAAKLGSA